MNSKQILRIVYPCFDSFFTNKGPINLLAKYASFFSMKLVKSSTRVNSFIVFLKVLFTLRIVFEGSDAFCHTFVQINCSVTKNWEHKNIFDDATRVWHTFNPFPIIERPPRNKMVTFGMCKFFKLEQNKKNWMNEYFELLSYI